MDVVTTADVSNVGGVGKDDPIVAAVAAAESALAKRFGATIKLADAQQLGGSGKSTVLRVRVVATPFSLPRSLVVKHYQLVSDEVSDPFPHEVVSYQLFTALGQENRICPELIAHDATQRVIVLEDLGLAPTLAEKLVGDDARSAERALLAWAHVLGRIHVSTADREADFNALTRRFGAKPEQDAMASKARTALAELPGLLLDVLGVTRSANAEKQADRAAKLLNSNRYRAFGLSDACADNNLVTSKGLRFLDFEDGCVRDVVLDAAYLRVPFPLCGCSFRLPSGMAEAMLAAWRAEVSAVWPDLQDDSVLMPRLLDAQLLWVWLSTWMLLPRTVAEDGPVDSRKLSARRSAALHARWVQLQQDAEHAGRIATAEYAGSVAVAMEDFFGADVVRLPLFPAFQ